MSQSATIIEHPTSPRSLIGKTLRQYPALAAIAVHLPPVDHPQRRQCERLLNHLFRYRHFTPTVSLKQGRAWLDDARQDEVLASEIPHLRDNPETSSFYHLWRIELWLGESDPWLQDQAKFYVGLLWRLYRCEVALQSVS